MNRSVDVFFAFALIFIPSHVTFAQGIGEYGRVVGGVSHGSRGVGPRTSGVGVQNGKGIVQGVGGVATGSALPDHLVVSAKAVPLYPRQDDETDQIDQLSQGELLVPMMYSTGAGTDWYLVKTQKGIVGWIKSAGVKKQEAKKP